MNDKRKAYKLEISGHAESDLRDTPLKRILQVCRRLRDFQIYPWDNRLSSPVIAKSVSYREDMLQIHALRVSTAWACLQYSKPILSVLNRRYAENEGPIRIRTLSKPLPLSWMVSEPASTMENTIRLMTSIIVAYWSPFSKSCGHGIDHSAYYFTGLIWSVDLHKHLRPPPNTHYLDCTLVLRWGIQQSFDCGPATLPFRDSLGSWLESQWCHSWDTQSR